jgi:hypothetical protein
METQPLRVVSTDAASQGPFVWINPGDFDPAVHTLYVEGEAPKRGRKKTQPLTEQEPQDGNG